MKIGVWLLIAVFCAVLLYLIILVNGRIERRGRGWLRIVVLGPPVLLGMVFSAFYDAVWAVCLFGAVTACIGGVTALWLDDWLYGKTPMHTGEGEE